MKKFYFGMLMLLLTTVICFAAKPVRSYKDCQKLAAKYNMTVVRETEQMFYAEYKDPALEQKSYIICYTDKPYTDLDAKILCYYINGEFYSNIICYSYSKGLSSLGTSKTTIALVNEQATLKNTQGNSFVLTGHGIEFYTTLLKYHRADLLIRFDKELGIFIPDDKRKEYQLDNIDKLKRKLDILAGRIDPNDA